MMRKSCVSVLIRTRNEKNTVGALFEKLMSQSIQDFDTVVVDNSSTDGTVDVVKRHKIDRLISIPKGKFSHGRSLNVGVNATQGTHIAITNGHCEPLSDTWLEDGLANFDDPKVAGIDGYYIAGRWGTKWQQEQDEKWREERKTRTDKWHISNTNSMIRRDLWEEYHFDEGLSECEDYDWSQEMKSRGYKIVKDPHFSVFHKHPLTEKQWNERVANWGKVCDEIDKRKRPYNQKQR